ncbi:MAG: hypothetical protein IPK19_14700 [Chloroflexi bacterium]|nr:hypothetical protein [Chloroflexota bacterium]
MSDQQQTPPNQAAPDQAAPASVSPQPPQDQPGATVPAESLNGDEARYSERLERLGGEPAPVITPEEFARLQRAGQVHIDARGRVRTTRRSDAEAGVSLKKRRAWYAGL